jgi:hypothetical protein
VEGLGPGGAVSLNVEREIAHRERLSCSARIGFSTQHLRDFTRTFNPDLIFPIGVMGQYGGAFAAEIGGGPTITSLVEPDPLTFEPKRVWDLNYFVSVGVRYWRHGHWPYARIAYTPLHEARTGWRQWAAVSLGYAF